MSEHELADHIPLVYKAMTTFGMKPDAVRGDMGQQIWVRVLKQHKSFDPKKGKISTWIYCTVRFAICEYWSELKRKKGTRPPLEFFDRIFDYLLCKEDPRKDILLGEYLDTKMKEVLSPLEKDILMEIHFGFKPLGQVGKKHNLSKQRIHVLSQRALSKLRQTVPMEYLEGIG